MNTPEPAFPAGLSLRDYFAAKAMEGMANDYLPTWTDESIMVRRKI